jgi:hypothetical protein
LSPQKYPGSPVPAPGVILPSIVILTKRLLYHQVSDDLPKSKDAQYLSSQISAKVILRQPAGKVKGESRIPTLNRQERQERQEKQQTSHQNP